MADTNTTPPEPAPDQADDSASLEDGNEATELEDGSSQLDGGSELDGGNQADGSSQLDGASSGKGADSASGAPAAAAEAPKSTSGKQKRFGWLRKRVNIYLLLFIFVLLVAGVVMLVAYLQNSHTSTTGQIKTQSLSQQTLDQLANGDVTVGSNQSVLKVQASAVFAGQVLVRQGLQVAGNLQVGGTTALGDLTVAGTSQLGQVNIGKNLAVTGNTAIQGTTTIDKSLQVSGSGSFGGALTAPQVATSNLQLNGDLTLAHHITTSGSPPGRSGGSALGGGGSASVSGSDTAGSISINTGSGPAAGCFVTINFASHYANTPHVIITPVGSAGGGLAYYINRSTTGFSVCDASPPPAGASFGFDYFVID